MKDPTNIPFDNPKENQRTLLSCYGPADTG